MDPYGQQNDLPEQQQPNSGGGQMSGMKRRFSRYGQQQATAGQAMHQPGNSGGMDGHDQHNDQRRGFQSQMRYRQQMPQGQANGMGSFANQSEMPSPTMQAGPEQPQQPQVQPPAPMQDQQPVTPVGGTPPSQPAAPVQQTAQAQQPNTFASPFGKMNFGSQQPNAMRHGGVATHRTEALAGEHGHPEQVVKLGRYGGGAGGFRGDGASVPGNEPGGAHGRYGGLSHMPDQEANTDLSRAIERDAEGGIISSPTRVMLEPGEAVVPLDGHAGSHITPGMVQPRRYRMTGPSMTHHPIGTMTPAMLDKRIG